MTARARRTTAAPRLDDRFGVPLRGVGVDDQTRCAHYDGPTDVVALRFACCETFYPCHACHDRAAGHAAEVWPRARFDEPSVLCGVCRAALTAPQYLACGSACPACGAAFNPGCSAHLGLYLEGAGPGQRPGVAGPTRHGAPGDGRDSDRPGGVSADSLAPRSRNVTTRAPTAAENRPS